METTFSVNIPIIAFIFLFHFLPLCSSVFWDFQVIWMKLLWLECLVHIIHICSDCVSSFLVDEVGIDHWNEFEDCYAFVYSKPEKSSKKVLVKCLVMNNKLLIDAFRDGDNEPLHLELRQVTSFLYISNPPGLPCAPLQRMEQKASLSPSIASC